MDLYSDWFCCISIDEYGYGHYSNIAGGYICMSKLKAEYIAKKLNNGEDKILKFIHA